MPDQNRTRAAFEDLAGSILSGSLQPRAALPTSRKLASRWGTNSTAANGVLAHLVEVGLAEPGRPRVVAPVPAEIRELRPVVGGVIDHAMKAGIDLQSVLLLVRGIWQLKELQADHAIEDQRYARYVPAELVSGDGPEVEQTDYEAPLGKRGTEVEIRREAVAAVENESEAVDKVGGQESAPGTEAPAIVWVDSASERAGDADSAQYPPAANWYSVDEENPF